MRRCGSLLQRVVGVPGNGVKPRSGSVSLLQDIVGLSSFGDGNGPVQRLPAGDLLGMIDVCAVRSAQKHAFGPQIGQEKRGVATVSMDEMAFVRPVIHGDQVRLEGSLSHAGSSSVVVDVDVSRMQFPTNDPVHIARATVTMVCIGSDLRPLKCVPQLDLETPDGEARNVAVQEARRRSQVATQFTRDLVRFDRVPGELLDCPMNASKAVKVSIQSTELRSQRLFMPKDLNLNDTIFGGEIIRWMELNAVHCGRIFCGNRNVVCALMHSVDFTTPIFKDDWIELRAYVVYVRRTTMEVDVVLSAERDGTMVVTNRASFVLAQLDETGHPRVIPKGLDVESVDRKWQIKFANAKQRYHRTRDAKLAALQK